jgi:hypothetical protein
MTKAVAYVCPACKAEESYYGRLVFPGETEPPMCPHHKKIALIPVKPPQPPRG